jgi:tetratricopeptide (TPR) repeat protein
MNQHHQYDHQYRPKSPALCLANRLPADIAPSVCWQQAIDYLGKVLEISDDTGDHIGDVDAYGTIADIYTEMGEFEKAAEYYDKYIGKMAIEGPV